MGSQTTGLLLPYPVGTDRVMDGDNAIQALAERIEARMPWGWLAYTETTVDSGNISNTEIGIGLNLVVTVPAGRRVKLSTMVSIQSTVAGDLPQIRIKEGTTVLQAGTGRLGGVSQREQLLVTALISPAAGTHTYSLAAIRVGGTGVLNLKATTTETNWFMAEDVGPASLT